MLEFADLYEQLVNFHRRNLERLFHLLLNDLGYVSKSDVVHACGYVSEKKDASNRLHFTVYYETLLEAKGVNLGTGGGSGVGQGGRKLSYKAVVQGKGNLLIGKAYTAMLELEPGDEFQIKLGMKAIRLMPVGGKDEEDAGEE